MSRQHSKVWVVALAALVCVSVADAAPPQQRGGVNRTNTWEMTLQPRFLDQTTLDFEGGAKAQINDDVGFGFGFAYNKSNQLALGFDISWNSANYTATRVLDNPDRETQQVGGVLDSSSLLFGGTYYLGGMALAPFVSANLGWTYVDSNIPTGPEEDVCWWDPYWGYVCGSYVPTASSWEFTYGAGLGLRWDMTNRVFLRGSANRMWIDFDKATDTTEYTVWRVDIGFAL